MELYRVTIPKDDAWSVVEALGNTDSAHFIDLNKNEQPFNLPYAQRIKLAEETERRIHYLIQKCKELRIKIYRPKSAEYFAKKIEQLQEAKGKGKDMLFDAIESDVADKEAFVQRMSKQIGEMQFEIQKMEDYERVLGFVQGMVPQLGNAKPVANRNNSDLLNGSLNNGVGGTKGGAAIVDESAPLLGDIQFISGTIKGEEHARLEKLIFRSTRGKALTFFQEFMQNDVPKCVYMVVF